MPLSMQYQLDLPLWRVGTLRHVLQSYLSTECVGLADATLRDYVDRAAWLARVFGDDVQASHVTYARLRDVIARYGPQSPHGLLQVTLRKRLVLLLAALKHAWAMGWLEAEPPPMPRLRDDGERRRQLLTSDEWPRFEAALCPGPTRRCAQLMWWCGSHNFDAFGTKLAWFDLDYDWGDGASRGRWLRHNHKNPRCEPLWLPMEPGMRAAVAQWESDCGPSREAFVCGHVWNLVRAFAQACARADVARVAPIDLRRSAASRLLAAGHSDEYVRQWLGHIGPPTADGRAARPTILHKHYARPTPDLLLAAARRGR